MGLMNPNQYPSQSPEPQGQYSDERMRYGDAYLNQISAPVPVKTINPFLLWGVIGGFLLILGLFIFMLFNSGGPSRSEQFTAYVHRAQALTELTRDANSKIKNSNLRSLNASTTSVLTSATTESNDVLESVQLSEVPSANDKSPITAEYTELEATLEDAGLMVEYDRVYVREITHQLATIRTELSSLYESTNSSTLREYLKKTDANLKPLMEQFSAYSNTHG